MELKQYDIVLVNLNPTRGSEIKKTRLCLIISPNEINDNLRTITIAPMTTKSRAYPTRIRVMYNNRLGWVILDQIRSIDKARIIKKSGVISSKEIKMCKSIIKETFVD